MATSSHDMESLVLYTATLGWSDGDSLLAGLDEAEHATSLVLVGKLITDKPLHKLGVHQTIFRSWFFVKDLEIEEVDANGFLFTFPIVTALERVLAQSPWNIKGHLLVLKKCPLGVVIADL